jgi:hypothetical protein
LAIYRIFAETPATPEGVLTFANRYGMLFAEEKRPRFLWPDQGDSEDDSSFSTVGKRMDRAKPVERVNDWVHQIWFAAETVALWDLVRNQEHDRLRRRIRWHGKKSVSYVPARADVFETFPFQSIWNVENLDHKKRFLIGSAEKNPEAFATFTPGEVDRPAWLRIHSQINEVLPANVAPGLFWDHRGSRTVFQDMPLSLLGAIYLQLANAVAGNRPSRRCEVCGRWFELDPAKTRADRRMCSNTCRTKSYRQRQITARDLHARGKSPQAIARALRSDVRTVKNWIGE